LLGKRVFDPSNKPAGRIEEIRAHVANGECVIVEYLLGSGGLMQRLSVPGMIGLFTSALGGHNNPTTHRVSWDLMDLSDPEHPRVTVPAETLPPVDATGGKAKPSGSSDLASTDRSNTAV
jgi:hypothetical protein